MEMAFKDRVVTNGGCTDNDNTDYLVVFWSGELDSAVGECVGATFGAYVDGWWRIDVGFRSDMAAFRESSGLVGVWFG